MSARVPAPLAEVLIPEWGSVWPVVEVDGDRWTVECFGRRRELSTDQVELLFLMMVMFMLLLPILGSWVVLRLLRLLIGMELILLMVRLLRFVLLVLLILLVIVRYSRILVIL